MAATALRREEGYGLALAIAAHVGLAAFLLWRPPGDARIPPPERMTVTISDEVGLTSTSPQPNAEAAPDRSPQLGEPAPEPEAEAEPDPAPEPPKPQPPKPQPKAEPEPRPKPVARPQPRPVPRPAPRPVARPQPRPVAKPATPPVSRPVTKPATKAPSRPAPSQQQPARPTTRPGSSSFSEAFKTVGPGNQPASTSTAPPAAAAGPAVQASLVSAISRALKPRWAAPQGADADKLVTILSWNLNPDGSLAGTPRVVRQEGITDANRPQAARHAEQAIRAVQLAAPFDLPEQYYNVWKRPSFRFDRKLSL